MTQYPNNECRRERIRLIASIESALGMMNIKEIATADPRLDALIVCIKMISDKSSTTNDIYIVCCGRLLC